MTDYSYKKIVTREENIENIKIWELIFFLFWDNLMESKAKNIAKKSYKTEDEIVEAIKDYYKDKAITEKGKERLSKLTQSGVSKGLKALNNPVVYQSETYIIQKSPVSDKSPEWKEYQINIFNIDIKEKIWKEERHKLLSADLLVKNQMCPVSKYMYIFKMKPAIVRIKNQLKKELTDEKYKEIKKELEKKQLRKNIDSVKKHFRNMIDSATLFDVTSSGEKIMVMLNKTEDISLYSRLFDNFFKAN